MFDDKTLRDFQQFHEKIQDMITELGGSYWLDYNACNDVFKALNEIDHNMTTVEVLNDLSPILPRY